MGCVFLEMATVLEDRTLEDMELFYSTQGTTRKEFHKNEVATKEWIYNLSPVPSQKRSGPLSWIASMLQEIPRVRPTASQVVAKIADAQCDQRYFCFRCYEAEQEGDDAQEAHYGHSSATDMVTGLMLQTYMHQNKANENSGAEDDDTVSAQFLEDAGAVTIASGKDVVLVDSAMEMPDNEQEDLEDSTRDMPEHQQGHSNGRKCEEPPADGSAQPSRPVTENVPAVERNSQVLAQPRSALKTTGSGHDHNETKDIRAGKQVTFGEKVEEKPSKARGTSRFSGLGEDRRPLPSETEPEPIAIDEQPIVAPEPLRAPPLNLKDCYPLPRASLVPSYILAGSNRFSPQEVRASHSTITGTSNLFVYGRLMFPSALRGFAAASTGGVYSPMHQRRLIASSQDWSKADSSIQRAAEVMTPACLKNFDV